MTIHQYTFRAIGCTNSVLTTDATALEAAVGAATAMVDELDRVASRFRADSEISRITAAAKDADVQVVVSELLGGCLQAALHAADITDGLVDPTVGRAVAASGHDVDIDAVRARDDVGPVERETAPAAVPGWHAVAYDPPTRTLTLPRGTVLDLGATAKAHAADLIAARLGRELRGGFLVNLGGDIAVSGLLPIGGWDIGVEDENGVVRQVVVSSGQAVATSSTRRRIWTAAGGRRHHIVDPRTGRTAASAWSQVTCAGLSALEANAATTAAVVLGVEAPEWLAGHGIPARLDPAVGHTVVTSGWPNPERRAA
jgi:thiamine biosynthesis lipoprotein